MKSFTVDKTMLDYRKKIILGMSFVIFAGINIFVLKYVGLNNLEKNLTAHNKKVANNLSYVDGSWDIQSYLHDESINRLQPLYIITSEGFFIDRRFPITDFLDTSDYHFASSFVTPQLITTPTGNSWIMYSRYIINNSINYGVLTLGLPSSVPSQTEELSRLIITSADSLLSQIQISHNEIDPTKITTKNLSNLISFQIINNTSQILYNFGNLPSYIDRSRVSQLIHKQYANVTDKKSHRQYLLAVAPLRFNGLNQGVVISGLPLDSFSDNFKIYTLVLLVSLFGLYLFLNNFMSRQNKKPSKSLSLKFDKSHQCLVYNQQILSLPLNSNQYYLAKLLVAHPNKIFETDELAELIFGSTDFSLNRKYWRQLYDSARLLNGKFINKFGKKLVITSSKSFILNPDLVTHVDST